MKKKIIPVVIVIIALLIGCVGYICYRNNEVKKYSAKIEKQLDKMDQLQGEAYFLPEHEKDLKNLKKNYETAKSNKSVGDIKEISNEAKKLATKTSGEISKYNEYYKLLKKEIEESDKLQSSYYAKDYDLTKISETKSKANDSINNSDFTKYEELYGVLSEQDKALSQHIDEEMSKTYNVPTNLSEQYPFGIDESSLSKEWSYHPLVKQKKNFPTWVITSEADTLDEPPYANLFIDDSSNDYDYSINQIDTKEITVQDKNRELQKALVNTEVTFKKQADYDDDEYTALNERPAYLLKMKSGAVYLALQNYDGEDYYILYQPD